VTYLYLNAALAAQMPAVLYAYIILASSALVVARNVFMVMQPAFLALYFVAAELLV
tara:strand:+ start:331 stop:498 length:168 start_codon:yes stop_codon:yes gene_type:complete